jgi:hypothetical protein
MISSSREPEPVHIVPARRASISRIKKLLKFEPTPIDSRTMRRCQSNEIAKILG